MGRPSRMATYALVAALGAGCQGVALDLGPEDPGDPTCPEVVRGADLSGVDFGHYAGADCLHHFTQTAADLDQLMTDVSGQVAAACDAIATAGGVAIATGADVTARCDAAATAIASGAPYAALGPFTLRTIAAGVCTPGRAIACGACGAPCSEADSSAVRATCSPPELEVVRTDTSPLSPAALAAREALQKNLPIVLGAVDARGDAFVQTSQAIAARALKVTVDRRLYVNGRFDVRGIICMSRSSRLIDEEALSAYQSVADAAARLRTATPANH
jgi:hypothetical protein